MHDGRLRRNTSSFQYKMNSGARDAAQREMRAAPARALSPRPTTTTAASPCPAARRAATAAARAARSEDRGESGTIGLPV